MPKTKDERKKPTAEAQPAPTTSRRHGPAAVLPYVPDNLFRIDLNLDSDSDEDQPLPVPEPSPDTESDQDPTPVASPDLTPPPTPPPPAPPPEHLAWVPYDKNKTEPLLPAPTRVTDPCDFYIDAVRFLPDNITFCKVTGRVANMYMSKDERVPDVVALPQLDSSNRCPSYRCRVRLNENRVFLNANMTIVLRVYGYEKHLRHVAVVGACLIQVFDNSRSPPTLCVGGVQRRLRHGLPDPPAGLENMVSSDMDYHVPLPGVSICVRLLPASQEYVEAPPYESGYYRSEECCPWTSERRLFRHYICRSDYRTNTVATQLKEAQKAAGKAESTNDEEFQRYMEESLDWRAQQKRTKLPPPDIDYTHYVHYDTKLGLKAAVQGVFSLPENLEGFYCHAYCRVLPGEGAKNLPEAPGDGRPQHFITRTPDFLSYQRSPQWLDDPETLHLQYDERSILLVQVYGFLPKYLPGSGFSPGSLTSRDGSSITLDYNKPLAWTFTQIFDQGSVIGGVHWLPLLEGQPDPDLLATLSQSAPAHQVLATKKSRVKPLDDASLELKFWDGHLEVLDIIESRAEALVKVMGKTEKYSQGQMETFSKTLDEFYLENMDGTNKDGPDGEKFNKEREFFESEANKEFLKAMNKALKDAGLPMLPTALDSKEHMKNKYAIMNYKYDCSYDHQKCYTATYFWVAICLICGVP
ncbi:uncharacterized protein [Panulirus ornatus]|uniref:uncharacterized protein n=1 Tax=Panulirus ornatus TaxID=150431 RepID=UPI003A8B345E